jgi:exosortase/archaeosortase family protein
MMKLNKIKANRKALIVFALILLLLLVYVCISYVFNGFIPFVQFINYITLPFLILVEKLASLILYLWGSPITIFNHGIVLNGDVVDGFTTQIMYKKYTILFILILWFTKSTRQKKVLFTVIFLLLNFLAAAVYIAFTAMLVSGQVSNSAIISNIHCFVLFCMNSVLLFWYFMNRTVNTNSERISGIILWIDRKLFKIIIIIYVYAITLFSLGYFSFNLWISFILNSSQKIVEIFGYNAFVEDTILIGDIGSVSMYRTCLGLMTMFLFAALIYLTANNQKKGWGFIVIGLFFLNLINILRVVLLFIYIQVKGTEFALDVHNIFNYVTYVIVFVLWIIWFEKYLGIRQSIRHQRK